MEEAEKEINRLNERIRYLTDLLRRHIEKKASPGWQSVNKEKRGLKKAVKFLEQHK